MTEHHICTIKATPNTHCWKLRDVACCSPLLSLFFYLSISCNICRKMAICSGQCPLRIRESSSRKSVSSLHSSPIVIPSRRSQEALGKWSKPAIEVENRAGVFQISTILRYLFCLAVMIGQIRPPLVRFNDCLSIYSEAFVLFSSAVECGFLIQAFWVSTHSARECGCTMYGKRYGGMSECLIG